MLTTRKIHALELTTIVLYAILLAIISYFHEPWFDEAQAWLIARDSSLFDMIWHVLRYEGHTPLWYLFLYIPSHLGVPFEIGLKSVNFVFATLAAAVFIKYAPFPLPVRLLTPFTYFLFYQYSVINRSYSLLMLLLWIIAAAFPKRNVRPFLFSILLALLGGVTAHGMLIAFGIAVAWLIETLTDHRQKTALFAHAMRQTATDRRFHSLVFLGLVNIAYVAILWPMPDKYTRGLEYDLTIADRVYRLLVAPVGAFFLGEQNALQSIGTTTPLLVYAAIAGFILLVVLFIWTFMKGTFHYAILSYLTVSLFMTYVYFSPHHTGIYTLVIIFLLWISLTTNKPPRIPYGKRKLPFISEFSHKYRRTLRKTVWVGLLFFFSLQIYWSAAASLNDIRLPYAPYRELASFIQKNEIYKHRIFDFYDVSDGHNLYFTANLAVLAYFPRNIFYNQNPFNQKISFGSHRIINQDKLLKILKASGKPEFIIRHKDPLPFYDYLFSFSDYSPIKVFEGNYMWKDTLTSDSITLYMRKDMLPSPGIIEAEEFNHRVEP